MLGAEQNKKDDAIVCLREQIRACFHPSEQTGTRVELVLGYGYSPDPQKGNRLAQEVMKLLPAELGDIVSNAQFKDFHVIEKDDPFKNGVVRLEVYYSQTAKVPISVLGSICEPPPQTWCKGKSIGQKLIVFNWASLSQKLVLRIDNEELQVKPAYGDYRTIGCIVLSPGYDYTWRADIGGRSDAGVLRVENGKDEQLVFCVQDGSLSHICPSIIPEDSGPGTLP